MLREAPPPIVAVSLLVVLERPPLTLAEGPLAVLNCPPLTLASGPLASFLEPPLTLARNPVALFKVPPVTLALSLHTLGFRGATPCEVFLTSADTGEVEISAVHRTPAVWSPQADSNHRPSDYKSRAAHKLQQTATPNNN